MKKRSYKPDKLGNIHVGRFYLGWRQVDLFATMPPHEGGGCFYYSPEDGRLPRIKVSIQYKEWNAVVAVLLHEAMEFAMEEHKLRFTPSGQMANSHASYLFVMNHEEFTAGLLGAPVICGRPVKFAPRMTRAERNLQTRMKRILEPMA